MAKNRVGIVCAVLAVWAAALLVYAERWAFAWDESFHLLAAQLIGLGRRPYIDFCFPQTPLNAYWNSAWMRLLGENWRVPHAFAALFTIGAVLLTARFVYRETAAEGWRAATALSAALLVGLNAVVFTYAPLAQAYGICLFSLVLAFRFATGVDCPGSLGTAAVGLFAGIAAASSLLSAAAVPVFLVWTIFQCRSTGRWARVAAFCLGTAIPFAPVIWLAWQGPEQAWFNLVQYHASFRSLYSPDATRHDLEILTSWIDSGQTLLLGALALAGLVYIGRRSGWPAAMKSKFYLSAWLAAGLAGEASIAHPTFPQYFLLAVPFLAILAAVGLYAVASRALESVQPIWVVLPIALFMLLGLGKYLYDEREAGDWSAYEHLAQKVNEITPRDALVFADEPIYFLTRRAPPPGLEMAYSHKIDLGPAKNAQMHIVTVAELRRQLQAGVYATAYSCFDSDTRQYGLDQVYQRSLDVDGCTIFWDLKKR